MKVNFTTNKSSSQNRLVVLLQVVSVTSKSKEINIFQSNFLQTSTIQDGQAQAVVKIAIFLTVIRFYTTVYAILAFYIPFPATGSSEYQSFYRLHVHKQNKLSKVILNLCTPRCIYVTENEKIACLAMHFLDT